MTPQLADHLRKHFRHMCWLVWIERTGDDLYVWSGSYPLTYDGHLWHGYGYMASIESIKKGDGLEHVQQVFSLNGLDPSIVEELDSSVRNRRAKLWLAGIGPDRQIIRDPYLVSDLMQDTLSWALSTKDGTATLRLNCFEAMPRLGSALRSKWNDQGQRLLFPLDSGFKYNSAIALQGPAVEWTQ